MNVKELNTPTTTNHPHKWWMLVTLAFGLALIVLDGTIVGVSLPVIIDDLHLDISSAQWVTSLYNIIFASLLLACGRLGDRYGRRTTFIIGLVLFVSGSALAAMSTTAATLIIARVVQGFGGAFILPSTLSSVNAVFRGNDRAAAFGVWGAVMSGAAALGPLVGGALTENFGWQWIFWVNVPLGAIVLIMALTFVPNTVGSNQRSGFDFAGLGLSIVGFSTLVFGLIEGPQLGWFAPIGQWSVAGLQWPTSGLSAPFVSLLIAAVALTLFVIVERRRFASGKPVLLEMRMFTIVTFSLGNIAAMMVAVGEFGLVFVLPLFLQSAMGLGVMQTGYVLAAMAVGAFVSGALARHIAAAIGASGTVVLGLALEVFGTLQLAAEERADEHLWLVVVALVVYGVGLGLASAQLTSVVLGDIPAENSGQGSATQSAVRQVGSALGAALMGSVLSVGLAHYLSQVTGPAAQMASAVKSSAGGALIDMLAGGAPAAVVDPLARAFAEATKVSLFAAVGCLLLGLIASIFLRLYVKHHADRTSAA